MTGKAERIYPEGFEGASCQTKRGPCILQGRDVRCIVSVGMLTEGWDCNTRHAHHRA